MGDLGAASGGNVPPGITGKALCIVEFAVGTLKLFLVSRKEKLICMEKGATDKHHCRKRSLKEGLFV